MKLVKQPQRTHVQIDIQKRCFRQCSQSYSLFNSSFIFYLFTFYPAHCLPPSHPLLFSDQVRASLSILPSKSAKLSTFFATEAKQGTPARRT